MGPVEIQDILKTAGATGLLIVILVSGLFMLWRYHLSQVKTWTENQLIDTKAMIAASERSTSAIVNLTELLKANAAAAQAYQTEMRSRVYGELNELQKFRGEFTAHWEEIAAYFKQRHEQESRRHHDQRHEPNRRRD